MKLLSSLRHLVWLPLKALAVLFICQMPGMALPQGGQVNQGAATIQQIGDTKLNINQSTDRAVINWNSFSIAPQEWVNFQQPSSTSATLNRVTGSTPSSIAGQLTANGQVFLVNPNGIAFLPTARVDVAGLVASTLNIQDTDFMRGILRFEQMPGKPPASVVNQGLITVKEAGFAALVAPAVQNSGIISARLGKVVLASGTTVSLDFYGDGLLSVTVDPTLAGQITDIYGNKLNSLIDNQGNITAPGGIVTLTAQAAGQIVDHVINVGGIIEAKYAENRNGVIVLSGGQKGTVTVNGTLDVSGVVSGEKGGKVTITGEKIALNGNALIDASGDQGGGIVNIGGSLQGKGTLQNAIETTVAKDVQIKADAITQGNGGEVIVWADGTTKFAGFVSAKGGIISGDGGFAEVSGKDNLWMSGFADLSATNGKFGRLLLDPGSITIQDGTGLDTGPNVFDDTFVAGSLGLASVTIQTALATNGAPETITINGDVNITWNAKTTLTLNAGQNILMNPGAVIENTSTAIGFDAIVFNANTGGTGDFNGIKLNGSTLKTNGGNIQLTGKGSSATTLSFTDELYHGIYQTGGAIVTSTNGTITYTGTAGTGAQNSVGHGVFLKGSGTKVSTLNSTINITGTASQVTPSNQNFGIFQNDAEVSSTKGNINFTGTGAGIEDGIRTSKTTSITDLILGGGTSGDITLTADRIGLGNVDVSGTGKLHIQPLNPSTTIGIGNSSSGILNLKAIELQNLINGFSLITIGRSDGSGTIDIGSGSATFNDNLILQNPNGGGIKIAGTLSTGSNILTLNSGGAVTQTANIDAQNLELLGGGSYTLTNPGNNVINLATKTTNTISYTGGNGFTVGTVNNTNGITATGENVTLKVSTGTVTQTQAITADGLELLGAGSFILNNPNNNITKLAAATNDVISYTDANSFNVDTVNTTNGILSKGDMNLVALGEGDIVVSKTITNSATATANLNIKAQGHIIVNNSADVTPGTGALNVTLNSDSNSKNGGAIKLDAGTVINSNGGDIILGGGSNPSIDPAQGNNTLKIGIELNGADLTAGVGNIKLTGTGQAIGSFNLGIYQLNGAKVTTQGGDITYTGTGGSGTGSNHGIFLTDTNTIISTTGAGVIRLTGTGQGDDSFNLGIYQQNGAQVSSVDGDITYIGKGGNLIGSNIGIYLTDTASKISTTGTGAIRLTGTGGDSGSFNLGIYQKNGAQVTTTKGDITYQGTGGIGADINYGIALENSIITTGTGNITLTGTGQGTGSFNLGIYQLKGAQVTTQDGTISYIGIGAKGTTSNHGIVLEDTGTTIRTSGTGVIDLTGTGGNGTSNNFGIYQLDGAQVTAQGGDITYKGTGGGGADNNHGIALEDTDTRISTIGTGNITLTGTGQGTGTFNLGIYQFDAAQLSSVDGDITYTGTGGNGTGSNHGIYLTDTKTNISTTGAGAIRLTGTGGNTGDFNLGIYQLKGAQVSSMDGDITYAGTAGNGTGNNLGIILENTGTTISTTGAGAIRLTGTGGNMGAFNLGIYQLKGAQVSSVDGDITYTGTSGGGTDVNHGIVLENIGTSISTTGTGNITLTGTGQGTGSFNLGIYQLNGAQVTSTVGHITYTGTGANGADAIRTELGANLIGNNTTGKITFTSTNNGIIFNDVTVSTTNDILITSPGDVNQNNNGGLFSDGLELLGEGKFTLTNPNNNIAKLAAKTTNKIRYTDAGGFEIATVNTTNGISTTGIVVLTGNGTITQTQPITTLGLAILGIGNATLDDKNNQISTIAADTGGNLTVITKGDLTVGVVNPDGIENATNVFLQSLTGDIILNKSINVSGGITLVAENDFINNFGANALNLVDGIFLVYATSPEPTGNFQGFSVLKGSQQFNTKFGDTVQFIGNGFLYKGSAPIVPGLSSSSIFTEPITFTLDFNEREWRDLSDTGEAVLFPEALLCVNVPVNQTSEKPLITDPIILRSENLPNVSIEWETGAFPVCSSPSVADRTTQK